MPDSPKSGSRKIPRMKPHHEKVVALFAKLPKGKVLDLPTGNGVIVTPLRELGFTVEPCDIDPARYEVPGAPPKPGNLNERVPFNDHEFDHVACINGVHRIFALDQCLVEFSRVLKPGGHFILTIPNFARLFRRLKYLFTGSASANVNTQECKQVSTLPVANFRNMLLAPQLCLALQRNGYEILHVTTEASALRTILLAPFVFPLRLLAPLLVGRKREAFQMRFSNAWAVVGGGPHLIIVARKK